LITALVHGAGTATQDIQLVDSNGASICESLEVVAYSKIECLTGVNTEIAETQISVKVGS
jgi:hypothetical protein